jgi:hypothetical protein
MVVGLSISAFTQLHVAISLIGIVSGLVVVLTMLRDKWPAGWNILSLVTTIATSATGFLFPVAGLLPSHIVGIVSLIILAAALVALYARHMSGLWRPVYIGCAVAALYLNIFVGVVQTFQKLPFAHMLAPTQSEPPFLVTQLIVLVAAVVLGFFVIRRFHPPRQMRV